MPRPDKLGLRPRRPRPTICFQPVPRTFLPFIRLPGLLTAYRGWRGGRFGWLVLIRYSFFQLGTDLSGPEGAAILCAIGVDSQDRIGCAHGFHQSAIGGVDDRRVEAGFDHQGHESPVQKRARRQAERNIAQAGGRVGLGKLDQNGASGWAAWSSAATEREKR